MNIRFLGLSLLMTALLDLGATASWADTLETIVEQTLVSHPALLASSAQRHAANNKVREAIAGYLPRIDLSAGIGLDRNTNKETRTANPSGSALTLTRRELGFELSQMLFDGFATKSVIEEESALLKQKSYNILDTMDDIIIDVVRIYIDNLVLRSVVTHARSHVEFYGGMVEQLKGGLLASIRSDADIEHAVGRHAKARAELITQQSRLRDAQAEFQRITGEKPKILYRPKMPGQILPKSEDAAVAVAINNHPEIYLIKAKIEEAKAAKRKAMASYYPELNLEIAATENANIDGVEENSDSISSMLRLKYNIFRGGGDRALEREAAWNIEAYKENLNDMQRVVAKNMRQAWNAYLCSRASLKLLKEHLERTQKTVENYKKQYKLGGRSVVDVLNADDELYQAKIDYVKAQYLEIYASHQILHLMGKIRDHFKIPMPVAVTDKPCSWVEGY